MARNTQQLMQIMKDNFFAVNPVTGVALGFNEGQFPYLLNVPVANIISDSETTYDERVDKTFMNNVETLEEAILVGGIVGLEPLTNNASVGSVTFYGANGTIIPLGQQVSASFTGIVYNVIEEGRQCGDSVSGEATVLVACSQVGEVGNIGAGGIDTVSLTDITSVTNRSSITNGFTTEPLESYKERYYNRIQFPVAENNNTYYSEKVVDNIETIGYSRVLPANGTTIPNGSFEVVITNVDNKKVALDIKNQAQFLIDSLTLIGEQGTVIVADEVPINITSELVINSGTSLSLLEENISSNIENFLKSIFPNRLSFSIVEIADVIKDIDGVDGFNTFTVNGISNNNTAIYLLNTDTPVLGTLTFTQAP